MVRRAGAEAVELVVLAYAYLDDGDTLETIAKQGVAPDRMALSLVLGRAGREGFGMTTTTEPAVRDGYALLDLEPTLADMGALIGILGHVAAADTELTTDQLSCIEAG